MPMPLSATASSTQSRPSATLRTRSATSPSFVNLQALLNKLRRICLSRIESALSAPRFSCASTMRRFWFLSASCPAVPMTSSMRREEHGFSLDAYKTMKKHNLAPQETLFPGSRVRRITPDDYAEWLKRIQAPDIQMAEAMRRRERAQRFGRKALSSPDHPMNVLARLTKPKKRARARKLQAAE